MYSNLPAPLGSMPNTKSYLQTLSGSRNQPKKSQKTCSTYSTRFSSIILIPYKKHVNLTTFKSHTHYNNILILELSCHQFSFFLFCKTIHSLLTGLQVSTHYVSPKVHPNLSLHRVGRLFRMDHRAFLPGDWLHHHPRPQWWILLLQQGKFQF